MGYFDFLKGAAPVEPHPEVPAPVSLFNLDLRTVTLVFLLIDVALTVLSLIGYFAFIFLVYPIIFSNLHILLFVIQLITLGLDGFGFWAIYRYIPEYIKVYGYVFVGVCVWRVIQAIISIVGGARMSFVSLLIQLIINVLYVLAIRALYNYTIQCKQAWARTGGRPGAPRV
ncbi:hypothetical protein BJ742DRAFT_742376 [Cladochytrium replicatum]|nr:hypothetical protein BJ742DRAFT_742376 [Cladochytrium replicatum]